MFDAIRRRIAEIEAAPARVGVAAAARIQATLTEDATSARGNVPSYGKFGAVPITVTGNGTEIRVTAAGWVQDTARKYDEPAKWVDIVRDEAVKAFRGGV